MSMYDIQIFNINGSKMGIIRNVIKIGDGIQDTYRFETNIGDIELVSKDIVGRLEMKVMDYEKQD